MGLPLIRTFVSILVLTKALLCANLYKETHHSKECLDEVIALEIFRFSPTCAKSYVFEILDPNPPYQNNLEKIESMQ
jgi:hypothetical protein